MSATVFSPFVMSEMRRMMRGGRNLGYGDSAHQSPENTAVDRVRRNLFGNVDHSETKQFVERELKNQQDLDSERWGFDFVAGKPKTTGAGSIRYSWKKVKPQETIPEAYSLRRLPYLRTHGVDTDTTGKEQSSGSGTTTNKTTTREKQCNKQPKITDLMKKRKRTSLTASKNAATSSSKQPSTATTTTAAATDEPSKKKSKTTS